MADVRRLAFQNIDECLYRNFKRFTGIPEQQEDCGGSYDTKKRMIIMKKEMGKED